MSRSRTLTRLLSVSTALTLALLGAGCSSNTNPPPAEDVGNTQEALAASSYTFALPLPSTTGLDRVALAATGTLQVDDRAQVTSGSGFAEVVNTGTAVTTLNADSQVGTVTSVAPLTLRDRARVNGDATSGGVITRGVGSTITGATAQNRSIAVDRLTFTVSFPASGADLDVTSGRTTLAPSSRGNVHVFANTTLALGTGTYYFDQLTVEPQGALALDTQAGPVYVYVRTGLTYRGTTSFTGPNDRFLVGYAGSLAPALDKPLGGTLLAPFASVRLGVGGSPYAGAVFARDIEVDPDVRFTFRGFSGFGQVPFDVIPTLACVEQRPDQSYAALLGYYNPNATPATIAVGANNGFSPSPQNHGQPTTFLAGRHTSSFSADFGSAQTLSY
jgi:hypothetical protein